MAPNQPTSTNHHSLMVQTCLLDSKDTTHKMFDSYWLAAS